MADYISRQEAIKAIMDLPNCPNGYSDTYDKACIIGMLVDVPTADVVEVVRCKDCKYGHLLTDVNGLKFRTCNCTWGHGLMVDEFGFCKWGERRDDE